MGSDERAMPRASLAHSSGQVAQGIAGRIAGGVEVCGVVLGLLKYTREGVDALGQVLDLGLVQLEGSGETRDEELVCGGGRGRFGRVVLDVQVYDQRVGQERILGVDGVFRVAQHLLDVAGAGGKTLDAGVDLVAVDRLLGDDQVGPVPLVQETLVVALGAVGVAGEDGHDVLDREAVVVVELAALIQQRCHWVRWCCVYHGRRDDVEDQPGIHLGVLNYVDRLLGFVVVFGNVFTLVEVFREVEVGMVEHLGAKTTHTAQVHITRENCHTDAVGCTKLNQALDQVVTLTLVVLGTPVVVQVIQDLDTTVELVDESLIDDTSYGKHLQRLEERRVEEPLEPYKTWVQNGHTQHHKQVLDFGRFLDLPLKTLKYKVVRQRVDNLM